MVSLIVHSGQTARVLPKKEFLKYSPGSIVAWPLEKRMEFFMQRIWELSERERKGERGIMGRQEAIGLIASELCRAGHYHHSIRVAGTARRIGEGVGLSSYDVRLVFVGGFFHDIGKILVPLKILKMNGKLDDAGRAVIREHPRIGGYILGHFNMPSGIIAIAEQHHEKWDGTGYPYGLAGKDILVFTGIVKIADDYDAMTRKRQYSEKKTNGKALEEIEAGAGIRYDPEITKAALKVFEKKLME